MISKIKAAYILAALILFLTFSLAFAIELYIEAKEECTRLEQNQGLLLHNGKVEITQTPTGRSHASAPALNLKTKEFKQSGDTLVKIAKQIGIKTKRIEEAATATTQTTAEIAAPITYIVPTAQPDTTKPGNVAHLSWSDPWLSLTGNILDSVFHGTITSTDTLDIIVHRIPKRFLFFRYGCKEVKMDIISRNPHTKLTYAKFYKIVK